MPRAAIVLVNGRVVASASAGHSSTATSVAIDETGCISALGNDEDIRPSIGADTRIIDLHGRLALPAFADAHVHVAGGGFERLRCDLSGLRLRDDCLSVVADHARGLAGDAWVLGGGWSIETFGTEGPLAADLEAVAEGRPVFLPNRDHHSAWVSRSALRAAGIDRHSPDPADGWIQRDDRGEPTGALHDGAMRLVADLVPSPTVEELTASLLAGQAHLHALGVTRWQDAAVGLAPELGVPDSYPAYRRAASDGTLTAEVVGALWWDRRRGVEQMPDLLARREAASHSAFRATSVKVMVDGVCETLTAAMTEPYLRDDLPPGDGHDERGKLFLEPDELTAAVAALDAEGFQVHFHAIGDRAVTVTLDALGALPAGHVRARRHHLAHLQFVRPADIDRFAAIGATANFQALWACNEPQMADFTLPLVGAERAGWQYRIGTMARRGVPLAFGSDWPVSSPDPLQQVHVAVNRRLSGTLGRRGTPETDDAFLREEAITVTEAVDGFTRGVALLNGGWSGALDLGARADIAVLDQDIFAVGPGALGDTTVDLTIAGGLVVHGDE